jgi:hypothetical protein
MKPQSIVLCLLALALMVIPASAQATETPLLLRLSRDFGYGGGSRIQGLFTMSVDREDLARVEFQVDGQVVSTDTEAPFRYQFNTSAYSLGEHSLSAVGYNAAGQAFASQVRTYTFVTSGEGWAAVGRIAIPILGVALLVGLASALLPALMGRGKPLRRGDYGVEGAAVCARCGFPYRRHFFAPNMLIGRLERCPHCGKWAIARRATPAELSAAEDRMDADESRGGLVTDDTAERERRMIDESRFEE